MKDNHDLIIEIDKPDKFNPILEIKKEEENEE